MKLLALSINGVTIEAPGGIPTGGFTNSTTGDTILNFGMNILFTIAIVLALFYLVYGGIQWVISSGEKEKIANARKRIIYAIIGLIVIVLSVLIVNLILYFFGAPQIGK